MSTRAVIAVYTDKENGHWRGVYHHFDGYPSGLGAALWSLYHEHFNGLLPAMIEMLIDAHPHGWSSIVDADWSLKPTWIDNKAEWYEQGKKLPPLSYKYRGGESPNPMDETSDSWQEWAYVFDLKENTMTIFERVSQWDFVKYVRIETLSLESDEPDWNDFE